MPGPVAARGVAEQGGPDSRGNDENKDTDAFASFIKPAEQQNPGAKPGHAAKQGAPEANLYRLGSSDGIDACCTAQKDAGRYTQGGSRQTAEKVAAAVTIFERHAHEAACYPGSNTCDRTEGDLPDDSPAAKRRRFVGYRNRCQQDQRRSRFLKKRGCRLCPSRLRRKSPQQHQAKKQGDRLCLMRKMETF